LLALLLVLFLFFLGGGFVMLRKCLLPVVFVCCSAHDASAAEGGVLNAASNLWNAAVQSRAAVLVSDTAKKSLEYVVEKLPYVAECVGDAAGRLSANRDMFINCTTAIAAASLFSFTFSWMFCKKFVRKLSGSIQVEGVLQVKPDEKRRL
jgi:hypothetical protein